MQDQFPLFSSPLKLAHRLWEKLLCKEDIVIDATIGNGKDTLILAELLSLKGGGRLWGLDIQAKALETTKALLEGTLPAFIPSINLCLQSHETFPEEILPSSVKLIVYNLGYLPGADKSLTTHTHTTLISIKNALTLLCDGGCLSITCYPGHSEGQREYLAVHELLQSLSPKEFCISEHIFTNRTLSPILILLQKALSTQR